MANIARDVILPGQIDTEALEKCREPTVSFTLATSVKLLACIIRECQKTNIWRTFSRREICTMPDTASTVHLVIMSDPGSGWLTELKTLRPRYELSKECIQWCYENFPKQ